MNDASVDHTVDALNEIARRRTGKQWASVLVVEATEGELMAMLAAERLEVEAGERRASEGGVRGPAMRLVRRIRTSLFDDCAVVTIQAGWVVPLGTTGLWLRGQAAAIEMALAGLIGCRGCQREGEREGDAEGRGSEGEGRADSGLFDPDSPNRILPR